MPRCRDKWRRNGALTVGVKATSTSTNASYTLEYAVRPNHPDLPMLPGGTFDSGQLAAGVEWQVPEGYRSPFQLLSVSGHVLRTEIKLNGVIAVCHADRHCQGLCSPEGPAGISGDWKATAARLPSGAGG